MTLNQDTQDDPINALKKAIEEAFENGKSMDEAINAGEAAFSNRINKLTDTHKGQPGFTNENVGPKGPNTPTSKKLMLGFDPNKVILGGMLALVVVVLLGIAFLLVWPNLNLIGEVTPTSVVVNGEDRGEIIIDLTVENPANPSNPYEFEIGKPYSLTVKLTYEDGLPVTDGTKVQFTLDPATGNFSSPSGFVLNGQMRVVFNATVVEKSVLGINVIGDDGVIVKAHSIQITVISPGSASLSWGEVLIRENAGNVADIVKTGEGYMLSLTLKNDGDKAANGVVICLSLPPELELTEEQIETVPSETSNCPRDMADPGMEMVAVSVDVRPEGQVSTQDFNFTVPYLQNEVKKNITINYSFSFEGQSDDASYSISIKNPDPGGIQFEFGPVTSSSSRETTINVTALDFNSQPVTYPVSLTFRVEPPGAGSILEEQTTQTDAEGKATVTFEVQDITIPEATIVVESGVVKREMLLNITPIVTETGSGSAMNHLYFEFKPVTTTDKIDLVNHRIIYQLPLGTPIQVLTDTATTQPVMDGDNEKIFYKVAVEFWMPIGGLASEDLEEKPLLSDRRRIRLGKPDDCWPIVVSDDAPADDVPAQNLTLLQEGCTDVDMLDLVIVEVVDKDSSETWMKVRATGWLAEDVIGFEEDITDQSIGWLNDAEINTTVAIFRLDTQALLERDVSMFFLVAVEKLYLQKPDRVLMPQIM